MTTPPSDTSLPSAPVTATPLSTAPITETPLRSAPVVQLLTGDDDADLAAARWAGSWGAAWSDASRGVRSVDDVWAARPALVAAGIPVAGGWDAVAAAIAAGLRCEVPAVCVPWWWGALPTARVEPHAVVVSVPETGADAVVAQAVTAARAHGGDLRLVRLWRHGRDDDEDWLAERRAGEQQVLDRALQTARAAAPDLTLTGELRDDDAYSWLTGNEHLASLLVLGVDDDRLSGLGHWAATHTVAATMLVPVGAARSRRPSVAGTA